MTTAGKVSPSDGAGPRKTGLSCAECRRSKLKCDRVFPCQSCIRRGCAGICPEGTLAATKGNKVLMAHAQKLSEQVKTLTSRVHDLEAALRETNDDGQAGRHPLLSETKDDTDIMDDDDVHEVYEAIGSLSIGLDGQAKYHGESAGSEYLQDLLPASTDNPKINKPASLNLPVEVLDLLNAFPFGLKDCPYSKSIFIPYIPSRERAMELASIYYRNFTWMYDPIVRDDFLRTIVNPLYGMNGRANLENLHSHRLSVFFIVLAHGCLYDSDHYGNTLADQYHGLARAALSLDSILREVTCATVQALFLVVRFMYYSDHDEKEGRWLLIGLCTRVAQTIGLQRDSAAWNLEPDEVQRRRQLFWELYTWESWTSLVYGRPGALLIQHSDCQFAEDMGSLPVKNSDEVEFGFHAWKARYSAACLSLSVQHVFSPKPSLYSALLDIDKTIRKFPIPNHLRSPVRTSEAGRSWSADPYRAMQQYCALCIRESNLLYIHRSYFTQAIRQQSEDPLRHKYAPSVLATYRSACRLISGLRGLYPCCPSVGHVWFFWSAVFSSCIVLGALVIESPACTLARDALDEFKATIPFYEEGSRPCRPPSTLAILQKLCHRANSVFSSFKAGMEDDHDPGHPDELEVLGGRQSVITKKSNSNSPANLVPGLPSAPYDGGSGSTSDSHSGGSDMLMKLYERSASPSLISNDSHDYEMDEGPRYEQHHFMPSVKPPESHILREGHGVSALSMANPYVANRPQAPAASSHLVPPPTSTSYRHTGQELKSPEIWQTPSYPPHIHHHAPTRPTNMPPLNAPYTNSPAYQAGASYGFATGQTSGQASGHEQNQDEIWRNFLLQFGG